MCPSLSAVTVLRIQRLVFGNTYCTQTYSYIFSFFKFQHPHFPSVFGLREFIPLLLMTMPPLSRRVIFVATLHVEPFETKRIFAFLHGFHRPQPFLHSAQRWSLQIAVGSKTPRIHVAS